MPFKTTKEIKSLANGGFRLGKNWPIGPGKLPDHLWDALVKEGAIIEVGAEPLTGPEDKTTAPTLDDLNIDELKALADERGVSYTWNIKAETLRGKLNDDA